MRYLRELLEGGRSMTSVAVDAGLDRTALNRVLRPDVRRVAAALQRRLCSPSVRDDDHPHGERC